MEGRGQPRGPREKARVRTQSRVALPPNLERVNTAAKQAAQTRARTSALPPRGVLDGRWRFAAC
ncbi:hypothetical protein GWG67_37025 [Bradyrhizobium sp. CSS354]|nr:hypothetical protein [Bradyrhizobium sp. CSS354]